MSTPMNYKICPACGQPAVLTKPFCGRCGRAFQSSFATGMTASAVPTSSPVRMRTGINPAAIRMLAACFAAICLIVAIYAVSTLSARRFQEKSHAFLGAWSVPQPNDEEKSIVFLPDGTGYVEYWDVVYSEELSIAEIRNRIDTGIPAPDRIRKQFRTPFRWHTSGMNLIFDKKGQYGWESEPYKVSIWSVSDDGQLLTLSTGLQAEVYSRKKP